jgi:uncharacterized membrane protein YfcA
LPEIPLLLIVELLLLGSVVGFLAGLLGVGGGMMLVPVLTWLITKQGVDGGTAVKLAIATSMATILFTSSSSVRAHHKLGFVRWDLVWRLAPGIVIGGLLAGAGAFSLLKGQVLALCFAAFIGWMALRLFRNKKPKPGRVMPGTTGVVAVGTGIGFFSGLVGAGGAFLSVPFMTRCNVPPREAVGTSAALGFPVAASATVGYMIAGWNLTPTLAGMLGYLYLPGLLIISAASMTFAPLGARTAQRIDEKVLTRLFAVLLACLSASMLAQAWRA